MTIDDLIKLYEQKKRSHGNQAYRYISELMREAKETHKAHFEGSDHEQAWRSFKGKNLEKLIVHIIEDELGQLGLKIASGERIARAMEQNLGPSLAAIKREIAVDYGEFGYHTPDADIIIYDPQKSSQRIVAILSVKVTLRERVAQTGYWKVKLLSQPLTEHIKVYFITTDEDGTLKQRHPCKKGRAIAEIDTHGSYVLSETAIEESSNVKMFDKFLTDIKKARP